MAEKSIELMVEEAINEYNIIEKAINACPGLKSYLKDEAQSVALEHLWLAAIAYDPNGTAENVAIKYDGDVTRNNAINSGDFGNVSAMLADHDEYTYGTVGIQARLEADVVMNENEDTNHTWLGTIEDVMNIMNKAGTTVSGS